MFTAILPSWHCPDLATAVFFCVFFFTVSRLLGTMELSKHKMMITVTTVTCIEKAVQAKNRTNTDIDPNA